MSRSNKKGRTEHGPPFVQLFKYMLKTPAWRSLKTADRSVYLSLAIYYNGSNNGFLLGSARQLAEVAGVNKDTVTASLRRLVQSGFIECAVQGGFSRKTRHAAEWRLTCFRCDRTGQRATKAFLKWSPKIQNTVRKEGSDGPLISDRRKKNRVACPKAGDKKDPVKPIIGPSVSDTSTFYHEGVGQRSAEAAARGAVQAKRSAPTPTRAPPRAIIPFATSCDDCGPKPIGAITRQILSQVGPAPPNSDTSAI